MSRSVYGSIIESRWLVCPARLNRRSLPWTRYVMLYSSRTSAMLIRTRDARPWASTPRDVRGFAAVVRDERVHQSDLGAPVGEASREVRPDEAEPARDQHPTARERLAPQRARAGATVTT